jgi:predicted branched-subunit amino acid permease
VTTSTFTLAGARDGALASLILAPTVVAMGLAFGILAAATGLSIVEAMLMSGWINAGSAQMTTLQIWADPVPIFTAALTTFAMNTRYILLGAALRPWLPNAPAYQSYPALFVLGDGNWALSLKQFQTGKPDAAYILASGALLWLIWVGSTGLGHAFGQLLGDPKRYGVDFFLAAFFASMVVAFLKKPNDALPFFAGALIAIAVNLTVSGPWYIFAGALGGSLVGVLRARAD